MPLGKKNKISERFSNGFSKVADIKSKIADVKLGFLLSLELL